MKKKLISLLLILIFVAQSLPLGVLAETANPAPTAEDLTSWIALTGLSKDAAGFHPGMDASRNMNALQMSEWIEDYEEESLFYLTDIFEDYDVAMSEQQNLFSDAGFASQIDLFYSCYDKVMEHRDEVSYYHDSIGRRKRLGF